MTCVRLMCMSDVFVKRLRRIQASRSTFIPSGVWDITTTRSNTFRKVLKCLRVKYNFAFYKSLKSRLIFMIFVLVLVPEVVLCFGILNTYESRAVSIRESEVLSQAKILANKISTSKYFDKDGSDLSNIDAQIDTLTTIYEGRVLIVDKHFKIIKDTYNLDDGNTIVSEEVIKNLLCFRDYKLRF